MQNQFKQDSQNHYFRTNRINPFFVSTKAIDLKLIQDAKIPLFDNTHSKPSFDRSNSETLEVILDRPFASQRLPITPTKKIIVVTDNFLPTHYRKGVLPVLAKVVTRKERTVTGLYMCNTAGIQGDIRTDFFDIYIEQLDNDFCIAYLTEINMPLQISDFHVLFKQAFVDIKNNSFYQQAKKAVPFKFYDHKGLLGINKKIDSKERVNIDHIDSTLGGLITLEKSFAVHYEDAHYFTVTKETAHLLLPQNHKERLHEVEEEIELNYQRFYNWKYPIIITKFKN
jgi:hypothetical protein